MSNKFQGNVKKSKYLGNHLKYSIPSERVTTVIQEKCGELSKLQAELDTLG